MIDLDPMRNPDESTEDYLRRLRDHRAQRRIPTLDLDAIKAREQAATPGPWKEYEYLTAEQLADPEGIWWINGPGWLGHGDWYQFSQRDAEFTAHARTDVPALIVEVERLRAELRAAVVALEGGGAQ